MLVKSLVAVLALFASSVSAQAGANSTINPTTVPLTLRNNWCQAQLNTCGTLCDGSTVPGNNTCDANTLNYTCLCAANQSAPGLQYYTGTLPTFICEELFQICINDTVGVAASQAKCNADEKNNCGHLDPNQFVAAAPSSSSASSSTSAPAATGSSGTAATTSAVSTTSSKAAAATMMAVGRDYGSGIVAAGVAAAFGLML